MHLPVQDLLLIQKLFQLILLLKNNSAVRHLIESDNQKKI
jgi:hypothetical protein